MTKRFLTLITLFLLIILCGCQEQTFTGGYAILYKDNTPYIINNEGNLFELTDLEIVDNNFSNLILVKKTKNQKEYYGYINQNGQEVIKATYEMAYPFSEGLAVVVDKGTSYLIDENNQKVFTFPKEYLVYDSFMNGFLRLEKSNKFCFINKKFEISDKLFDNVENFSDGLALTSKIEDKKIIYSFIDESYNEVISSEVLKDYTFVDSFHDGYSRVSREIGDETIYSFINKEGILLKDQNNNSNFVRATNFHDGYAVVHTGKYYYHSEGSNTDYYSFQYINTVGKYPAFDYSKYRRSNDKISNFWYVFGNVFNNFLTIRDISSGNGAYSFFKIEGNSFDELSLEEISISTTNLNITSGKQYYLMPTDVTSIKMSKYYTDTETLLCVVKIPSQKYGIIAGDGNYITPCIYDLIII